MPTSDTPIRDWLDNEFSQHLPQRNTVQQHGFLETEVGNITTDCALTLLSGRIVADEVEVNDTLCSTG
jgi:hypothetical protein